MGDYWRFADRDARLGALPAPAKRARAEFGAYLPQESRFDDRDSRTSWREPDPLGGTADLRRNGMGYGPPGFTGTDLGRAGGPGMGIGVPGSGGLGSLGISARDDPGLIAPVPRPTGLDTGLGKSGSYSLNGGRLDYTGRQDTSVMRGSSLLPPDATSTVFVEGIPTDCTRRESAHIFRPFIGFKEVRLVQKEPKRPGGEKLNLCFVEFADARCAATALEALQGYKFDENDRESTSLRLQFARFPGPRGGGSRDDFRGGRDRDDYYRSHGTRF